LVGFPYDGFPTYTINGIELVIGSTWINAPFVENETIILRHVFGSNSWQEDPNIVALNNTTNRLKITFSISPYTIMVRVFAGSQGYSAVSWAAVITTADISYVWKDLFNANPTAGWYNPIFFTNYPKFGGLSNEAFKSMEVGSVSSSSSSTTTP
jgi:hypothetical protein